MRRTWPRRDLQPAVSEEGGRFLGGDFWDKLGALFRYRTKVAFPDDGASLGRHLP